jgi:exosortase/archaeosortase family protein
MKFTQYWKNQGTKSFIIKLGIFLAIGLGTTIFISLFFSETTLFKNYLSIPSEFSVEAPHVRGIAINSFLFGIIAFLLIAHEKLLKIKKFEFEKNQIIFAIATVFILVGQYVYKYIISSNLEYFLQSPHFWGWIKLGIVLLYVIALELAVFGLSFNKYFIKEYRKEIILFIILSVSFFSLIYVIQGFWTLLSGIIGETSYRIFKIFSNNVTYVPYDISFSLVERGGPILGLDGFKAVVGKQCSGIDSFLLFTSLYALIFILDYKRLKKPLTIALFFVGAIGMFLTNILRILLLFIVGAYWSPKFAVGMFHTNAGWILFIVYFFVFWYFASKHVYKK